MKLVLSLPANAASPTRRADGAQHLLLALRALTIRAGAVRPEAIRCHRALVDCRVPWLGRRSPETRLGRLLSELFARYDLDESGSINGADEFSQLVTNFVFRLGISESVDVVQKKCAARWEEGMSLDAAEVRAWFLEAYPASTWRRPV